MSDINDFFKSAPDLLRGGVSQDQMAKLLASMIMIGNAMGGGNADEQEVKEHERTDRK